jgi:hypothetical protein
VSTMVVLAGALLYVVRQRQLFLYACLGLGFAFAVSVETCTRLGPDPRTSPLTLVFALSAATCIVVRAFDNLARAKLRTP